MMGYAGDDGYATKNNDDDTLFARDHAEQR